MVARPCVIVLTLIHSYVSAHVLVRRRLDKTPHLVGVTRRNEHFLMTCHYSDKVQADLRYFVKIGTPIRVFVRPCELHAALFVPFGGEKISLSVCVGHKTKSLIRYANIERKFRIRARSPFHIDLYII